MIGATAMGLLTGAVFGVALYKVAAIRHSRVLGMLLFADAKIFKFAFTAIAVASFGYGLADLAGLADAASLVPRVNNFTGWAHVVGGLIFGVSMAASGLCPGTAVCRATTNGGATKFAGLFAVIGLFLGVAVYGLVKQPLFDAGIIGRPQALTLHGWLGLPFGPVAMMSGVFFAMVTVAIDHFIPERRLEPVERPEGILNRLRGDWHWAAGGTVAGLTILWATTQGGYIGYSGSVLSIYGWAADAMGMTSALVPKVDEGIVWRAALLVGVGGGALIAHLTSLKYEWQVKRETEPVPFRVGGSMAAMGSGVGLALGAMIGGGCTTGAFMAAFPTLSLGSFAMGGTFFAAAVVTAFILNRLAMIRLFGGADASVASAAR